MPVVQQKITLDGMPAYNPAVLLQRVRDLTSKGVSIGVDTSLFINKCNSFTFSTGFEPGRGYILMLGEDVSSLRFSLDQYNHALKIGTVSFNSLTITECRAVTGVSFLTGSELFVVGLADKRIYGPLSSVNRSYNVPAVVDPSGSSNYQSSLNSGSLWTYPSMIQDLWSRLPPLMGSLSLSDASFSGNPYNYAFHGVSAWDALAKVCEDTDHILIYDRADATFSIVNAGSSYNSTTFDNDKQAAAPYLLRHSQDINGTVFKIPETIRVFFPSRSRAWQNSPDISTVHANDYIHESPLYSIDVATGVTGAVPGSIVPIHAPSGFTTNETGGSSNLSALTTLANQLADRYKQSLLQTDNPLYLRYSTARSFHLGPEVSAISYHDFGDGVFTDVYSTYRNRDTSPLIVPSRGGGRLVAGDFNRNTLSSKELNAAPNLGRWGEIPDRFAIGRLTTSVAPAGSGTALIRYGTNTSAAIITWANATPSRTATVFELTGRASYKAGQQVILWYDLQVGRWLIVDCSSEVGVPFINLSGETVPPFGMMKSYGSQVVGTDRLIMCRKPDTGFDTIYLLNGAASVQNGQAGIGYWGTNGALVATSDSAASPGESYGAFPNSFQAYGSGLGLTIIGNPWTLDGQNVVEIVQSEVHELLVKLTSDLNAQQSGLQQTATAKIYYILSDTKERIESSFSEITVVDGMLNDDETIESGTFAIARRYSMGYNEWLITNAYCKVSDL